MLTQNTYVYLILPYLEVASVCGSYTFLGNSVIGSSYNCCLIFNIVCTADLIKALRDVKAWYKLGLCLGVPVEVLQEIKKKHISQKKRARKMITAWMEKEITSWDKLVRALDDTGATSLACRVANRYGKLLNDG